MSDIDDVTAAAENIEHRIGLATPVSDRLDHATREQLIRLAQYAAVGEPTP